jgi:hypothetical protein
MNNINHSNNPHQHTMDSTSHTSHDDSVSTIESISTEEAVDNVTKLDTVARHISNRSMMKRGSSAGSPDELLHSRESTSPSPASIRPDMYSAAEELALKAAAEKYGSNYFAWQQVVNDPEFCILHRRTAEALRMRYRRMFGPYAPRTIEERIAGKPVHKGPSVAADVTEPKSNDATENVKSIQRNNSVAAAVRSRRAQRKPSRFDENCEVLVDKPKPIKSIEQYEAAHFNNAPQPSLQEYSAVQQYWMNHKVEVAAAVESKEMRSASTAPSQILLPPSPVHSRGVSQTRRRHELEGIPSLLDYNSDSTMSQRSSKLRLLPIRARGDEMVTLSDSDSFARSEGGIRRMSLEEESGTMPEQSSMVRYRSDKSNEVVRLELQSAFYEAQNRLTEQELEINRLSELVRQASNDNQTLTAEQEQYHKQFKSISTKTMMRTQENYELREQLSWQDQTIQQQKELIQSLQQQVLALKQHSKSSEEGQKKNNFILAAAASAAKLSSSPIQWQHENEKFKSEITEIGRELARLSQDEKKPQ